ncbi:MAG TPA: hypothetical protein VL354_11950 [Spirochaetia bacterium]|nr:hypothetical protein [Spirochaetia bacterium]
MTKGIRGVVTSVHPELRQQRLKVVATVKADSGEALEAYMPDREVSAILPRSVLLGATRTAPLSLLETVSSILSRMTAGRRVRAWQYKDRWFFSFQQWKGVRFLEQPEEATEDPRQTATPP